MNVPNELKMKVRRKTVPADRERLPFGWTPSPAYPGRLGVAGSVLIDFQISSITTPSPPVHSQVFSMSANFVLPGQRTNPLAFTKLQIAKAYTLSRSCNPRNIEFRSYGLWSQCLMDLTSDSKFLIVIPQHLLYYVPNEDGEDSASDGEDGSNNGDLADTT